MREEFKGKMFVTARKMVSVGSQTDLEKIISDAVRELKNNNVQVPERDEFIDGVERQYFLMVQADQKGKQTIDNSNNIKNIFKKYKS